MLFCTCFIILTQDCPHVFGVSVCCSRYDQHSCCFCHIFEPVVNITSKTIVLDTDAEVKNFASVNIVLTTIAAVSTIVAHRSEHYDRLSVFLSLFLSPL